MKKSTFVQRLSAWLLSAVMLLSAVPATATFSDTSGHWAAETLSAWQDDGLIDGYGDGSFRPNGTVTRAEFVKLMNRTLGFTVESAISFSDVMERDWFYAEVAKAAAAGYAQGSGGMFCPNQPVTRAEAAAMLARALDLAANEERTDAFADAASIPAWAKGSVGAAAEAGYMNGYPDGTFGALGSITRAEAVVTLDRVRKSVQETVIEKAGTTLENQTVAGDLIIAESVGEGNVTLKNVTVLGSVIVKGGGANSVYLDGVRVSGVVRLQKEGVHLRLMGDTALERVEIGLPCRLTQDSTFKGALGTLVIDLEKTSDQNIRIEVPAKLVELLSRANVALNADVETLRIDKDAEGAQLDIKHGASVGKLSIDARVALTGSGLVISLVVSASGVTVSGTLTVKETETEGGAKTPTVSGGSSGGGVTLKEITGIAAIAAVNVDYGTNSSAALAELPTEITLNVKDGSTVKAAAAGWSWADGANYSSTTAGNYTATTTFTVPSGCTYNGTLIASVTVTVKALDKGAFEAALAVAEAKLREFTVETDVTKATNPDTIYVLPGETEENAVTNGVKFILAGNAEYTALKAAIDRAKAAQTFASQAECNSLTTELTTAAANADELTALTGAAYTNAYIKTQIKSWLDSEKTTQTEWAISDAAWPLKYGQGTYTLPEKTNEMQLSANTRGEVALAWTITATGWADNLEIVTGSETDVKGVRVIKSPDAPMEITFKVSAAYNGTNYGEIGTYTATVGAPISLSENKASAPRFASGPNATGKIYINLNGVAAITAVDASKISIRGWTSIDGAAHQINGPKITGGMPSTYGVCLDASLSSGQLARAQSISGDSTTEPPMHETGKVTVTISEGALKLDESKGWYFPDEGLTQNVDIWVCNPQLGVNTQTGKDPAHRNISVRTKYVGDAPVHVAYTRTNSAPDESNPASDSNVRILKTLSSAQAAPNADGEKIYSVNDVGGFGETGTYYIWCRAWEGCGGAWLNTGEYFTVGGQSTQ